MPQFKPVVGRLQTSVSAQSVKRPVAPAVYRPQPAPRVLQPKMANEAIVLKPPIAPPVYRQEAKKIVQPKIISPHRVSPTAPPVYRPEQKKIAQPKMARVPVAKPASSIQARQAIKTAPRFTPPPGRTNIRPQRSSPVIQRMLVIDGQTYGPADKEAFLAKYPKEEEHEEILSAILDFEGPQTISAALEVNRNFYLTSRRDGGFLADADPLVKERPGGFSREAGQRPVKVNRRANGFEEVVISGMMSCVGVIIEARHMGRIEAAAASHFVTPDCVAEGGVLNDNGRQRLKSQIEMVQREGTLNAILVHAAPSMAGTGQQSFEAVNLIRVFLLSTGVARVDILNGNSKVQYQLKSDGTNNMGVG